MAIRTDARHILASLVAWVMGPAAGLAAEACWPKAELRHLPGEERIEQGVLKALVPPPRSAGRVTGASPFQWRGALRRVNLPPGKNLIALTFDLCEQPHEVSGYQGGVVDFLRDHQIKATFFVGGKWLLTHSRRAQQLVSDPLFEIANHAWEHRNLRLLSGSDLDDEIWNPQHAILSVQSNLRKRGGACLPPAKAGPMTLFRFPFGACNPNSLKAVEAAGLRAIQWDVSSSDPWRGQTAEKMVADVVKRVQPGSIVLFHANGRGWHTDRALPLIVARLKEQGYQFATVSEMLRVPGAVPVTSDTCYDSRPGDTDRYDSVARGLAEQHNRVIAALRAGSYKGPASVPPAPPRPLDKVPTSPRAEPAVTEPKGLSPVAPGMAQQAPAQRVPEETTVPPVLRGPPAQVIRPRSRYEDRSEPRPFPD